ncbi:transposase IS4 family protein [Microseira wollei NIES-4236]|uniref:Transposase IS4 family protein n=2 Tax=Microseira wollei TaxID=467598 RepID=A0AAV3XJT1_9CYAN|nr:transposase IS4 family protein [Microseira wollei NIES-4236]
MAIALLAVLSGSEGWAAIETYGKAKEEWLKNFIYLKNGSFSHDTFSRVFAALSPQDFQASFSSLLESITEKLGFKVIGIDGKTIWQSYERNRKQKACCQCCQYHPLMGQEKVDSNSNEITAIPRLLEQLDISESVVNLDGMGTKKEIAAQISQKKGNYILALKANQDRIYQ